MPSNIEMNNHRSTITSEPRALARAVTRREPRALARAVMGISVILTSGCQLMVNPFRDELAGRQEITTASVDGARAAITAPTVRQRDYAAFELQPENEGITHGPLYFEDSSEDKGSDDGRFAWTGEDYLHLFYWRGRFLVNTVFFPVSAVATPPWTVMESDGRISRQSLGFDYDAERRIEPAVAEPVDAVSAGG